MLLDSTIYRRFALGTLIAIAFLPSVCRAQDAEKKPADQPVIEDDFDRDQLSTKEKKWATNDGRALRTSGIEKTKFQPQARLDDGVLKIVRTKGSDHAATAKFEGTFQDALCEMKFRMPPKAKFSFNMNDPGLKETVHAGHVCRVEIGDKHVLIQDQKDGNMDLEFRKWKEESGASQKEIQAKMAGTQKRFKAQIEPNQWHRMQLRLVGDTIEVTIDDQKIGKFRSSGIGHPTKANIALSVPEQLEADDLKVWPLK